MFAEKGDEGVDGKGCSLDEKEETEEDDGTFEEVDALNSADVSRTF